MKYAKSTNKQRRERGDWPNNERMIHLSQEAWMQEVRRPDGVVRFEPRYGKGNTYRKPNNVQAG